MDDLEDHDTIAKFSQLNRLEKIVKVAHTIIEESRVAVNVDAVDTDEDLE